MVAGGWLFNRWGFKIADVDFGLSRYALNQKLTIVLSEYISTPAV